MLKSSGETQLEQKLLQVYKAHGLKPFLDTCASLLDIRDSDNWEKKKKVNGAVCEIVLFVMTMHYLKSKGYKGQVYHSLILNDPDNPKGDFRTELDFTLLSPGLCLTGECKSLVGDIDVTGECLLTRKDFTTDVGRQSKLHGKILRKHLVQYVKSKENNSSPPFELFCFVYSNGAVSDLRDEKAKALIPLLTITTLYPYYNRMFSRFQKEVFRFEEVSKFFAESSSSEDLYRQHRAFLGY